MLKINSMLKLVIDIGNLYIKAALFEKGKTPLILPPSNDIHALLTEMVSEYGIPNSCIISSVRTDPGDVIQSLEAVGIPTIISFSPALRLPVHIKYLTPETLGSDRIANICGASKLFPGADSLVVDIGTCIKYDFLSNRGSYFGGGISPGLLMRYRSLHEMTGQLPEYKPIDVFPELVGQSTEGSIRSGVENGIIAEIEGITDRYRALHNPLKVILTGGDSQRFEDKLKSPIFVAPNLTLNGLKVILDANE